MKIKNSFFGSEGIVRGRVKRKEVGIFWEEIMFETKASVTNN